MHVNPTALPPSLCSCPSSCHPHPLPGEPEAPLFSGLALGSWERRLRAAHALTGLRGGICVSLWAPVARGCPAAEDWRCQYQPSGVGRWRPGGGLACPRHPSSQEKSWRWDMGGGWRFVCLASCSILTPWGGGHLGPHSIAEQTEVQRS